MTTMVPVGRGRGAGLPAARGRAGLRGTLRSEVTKIFSVRSTYWSLIALAVITIGLGALFCFAKAQHFSQLPVHVQQAQRADEISQATEVSLFGLFLGQLVIAVLGALTITSEYSTGMIRTSLSVMPRRGVWLGAKAAVFAAVALVTGLVTSFASYFLGQPGVLRAVVGGGLFLAVCGMLSFGLGVVLRYTAGAITASIALLFVLYVLTGFLPEGWANHVDKWVPDNAGSAIWQNASASVIFRPWTGFALFCGYAAIALVAGLILFRRRDA